MTGPSFVQLLRSLPTRARALVVIGLLVAAGVLAVGFALEQAGTEMIAWWWPSTAVATVATMATRRRWRWATAATAGLLSGAAVYAAGRPLLVAATSAVANAFEAWLLSTAVDPDVDRPRLSSLRDVGRFSAAAALTAILAGALLGVARSFSGSDFGEVFWRTTSSHLSAVALLVPLALIALPRRWPRPWWHSPGLTAAILGATALVFWPGTALPLPFVAIPLLAWAAVVEPMFFAAIKTLIAAGATTLMTVLGGGIFAASEPVLPAAISLQIFTIMIAGTTLAIAASQHDRRELENRQTAVSHLLHDAFRQSKSGFVILSDHPPGQYSVLEINAAAVVLLRGEFERSEQGKWILRPEARLHPWLARATYDVSVTVDWEDVAPGNPPATVTIDAVNRTGLNRVLLLSIQDLRPLREAEREMEWQLERERQVSRTFQALNQQKVDFVASVTHELRTPVTSILGFAEELGENATDPELRAHVEIILRNATRLRGVIDDVLLVSRLSQKSDNASDLPVADAGVALRRSVEDATHSIREQKLLVLTEIEEDLPVLGRENDLIRVFTNILTNAIKFSPPRGTITIVAYRADGHVEVTITDQGEGISDEDLDHIFDRFYRSPSSTRRGVPGTGLGLAIVKELLTPMRGSIELSRVHPTGTTAQINLVLAERSPKVPSPPAE